MSLSINEKKEYLLKTSMNVKDIVRYFEVCQTRAYQIKRKALSKYHGQTLISTERLLTNAVFQAIGSSREEELKMLRLASEIKE